jgi:hypothetical protein
MFSVNENTSILRKSVLVGVFCFFQFAIQAQTTSFLIHDIPACKTTSDQISPLVGLRLGMTPAEASVGFGRSVTGRPIRSEIMKVVVTYSGKTNVEKSTKESIGEEEYSYYPQENTNLGGIYLKFWNERLYKIVFNFDKRDLQWENSTVTDYTAAIADKFGVPRDGWKDGSLTCDGFNIVANESGVGVQITIADINAISQIKSQAEKTIAFEAKQLGPPPATADPPNKPVLKRHPL